MGWRVNLGFRDLLLVDYVFDDCSSGYAGALPWVGV